jgi:hypothetical protein
MSILYRLLLCMFASAAVFWLLGWLSDNGLLWLLYWPVKAWCILRGVWDWMNETGGER